jgi:hypothetical protein
MAKHFSEECICFPADEQPEFRWRAEAEEAAMILCKRREQGGTRGRLLRMLPVDGVPNQKLEPGIEGLSSERLYRSVTDIRHSLANTEMRFSMDTLDSAYSGLASLPGTVTVICRALSDVTCPYCANADLIFLMGKVSFSATICGDDLFNDLALVAVICSKSHRFFLREKDVIIPNPEVRVV